ncbi:MAG: hypothetical protein WC455_10070 [Dehalococcoidia bacterium]|jgi:hypothetical protein
MAKTESKKAEAVRKAKSSKRSTASRKAALKRVGQAKSTGNFERISEKAAKRYGSKEISDKIAGKVYWEKVRRLGK